MKPPISFGLKTAIIIGVSIGLALAFNATRPDRLPLVRDPESAAQAAIQRGEISLAEAALLFRSGQAVFVDAREAGEYALGHIDGAISLDPLFFGQEYPAVQELLKEAATIVTYCDGELCELSHELAEQLKGVGLRDVRVLRNGWTLWREQGLPTATGDQVKPRDGAQEALEEDLEQVDAAAEKAAEEGGATPEPGDRPQLPEPREIMPGESGSNGTEQTNQTLRHAPQEHSFPEAEIPQTQPLEPAPLKPGLPEAAPSDPVHAEPAPEQPAPQAPSEEPRIQDVNPPALKTQGEQS